MTDPPSARELRRGGYTVTSFKDIRASYIEPARNTTALRNSLDNAAEALLRFFNEHDRVAIMGVPVETAGDVDDVYSFLIEPCFRRDVSLIVGVNRRLDALDSARLVTPSMGYAWSLQRLIHLSELYLRSDRSDGLPPLTPIEERLLAAMRNKGLTPQVQFGVGPYRVDFAFPGHRLAVEADGRGWHDAERDRQRDEQLQTLGWKTIRFSGSEIFRDAESVASDVAEAVEERAEVVTYTDLPAEPARSWWRRVLDWILCRTPTNTFETVPEAAPSGPVPIWKAKLDSDQRRAVDAHEGVVQVIAPAGSGKTTTMLTRVQELISRGIAANRILCTTFNRATREELEDRLRGLGIPDAEVRSFHALGRFILDREHRLRSNIGTASYGQWRRLAKQAMDSLDAGVWLDAAAASDLVSSYKLARMWDPETARRRARTPTEQTAAVIYSLYEEHLESENVNDFDDLILRAVELLRNEPEVRRRWQSRWDCVLVDEYQDIEPAQELLIRLVAAPQDSIFAVGDEDQCIYSWRRANVERIVMLDTVYPGLERVVLTTSYRCPVAITSAARELIARNRRRFPKHIEPSPISTTEGTIETHQGDGLADAASCVATVLAEYVDAPSQVVVLARTSRLLREVVQACADHDVPVNAPARAFAPTDAEESVLSYLRLLSSPRAASPSDVRRSFRVPNRYLPQGAETDVAQALRRGALFVEAASSLTLTEQERWRQKGITEWGRVCEAASQAEDASVAIRRLRSDGGLDRHYSSVEQMSPHDQIDVEALSDLESQGKGETIAGFVTLLEHRKTSLSDLNDETGIELATIHGAKGREWDTVILFGADRDQLPHFRTLAETEHEQDLEEAIEDERRLAYVALTRTKRRLVVVASSEPSPFLGEAGIVTDAASLPTRHDIDASTKTQPSASESPTWAGTKRRRPAGAGGSGGAPTTQAKYASTCPRCGRRIQPGTTIVRSGDRWLHHQCAAR